ncbi:NAD(P)/FAD-dependent oxidoreductase [Paenibacillus thermoaerophilus]|uniref:NAD(P)/FAD-dependent oxidoreductase n=1 Tax=Paenibacillus thermoaerophilus TaxID=1215385 RepID=A0ABW2V134_9BACL|nr:NAD(P)/FAD-dependent oxidoreductase [Paenibacillus thermoaerophilus]TMV18403.1 NAD(P)/FAD-dependent oxidoreductase [Paenibacillus thermoaerophilus]
MKQVVIIGGGYGGQTVANKLLEQDLPADTRLVLIDRMPFQGLKTEYYALAAGTVSDLDIRVPFPVDPRLTVRYGEITGVDLDRKLVLLDQDDPVPYEYLVLALGCVDKFHGIPGADQYTQTIQTLSATRRTYQALNDVRPYGQVTIVGGGLSGVELASELRESRPDLNIRLLDRGPRILSHFPEGLSRYVHQWFTEHHVELVSNVSVSRVEQGVVYNREQPIVTDVTVWTAGIQPSPIVQALQLPKDPAGRLIIDAYHQLPDYPGVFIVGDCASLPHSPSGQLAQHQGAQVAEVLQAIWKGTTPHLKKIRLRGMLGSLGKKAGFGVMGKSTVMLGKVPRLLKSGVLWKSKRHFG